MAAAAREVATVARVTDVGTFERDAELFLSARVAPRQAASRAVDDSVAIFDESDPGEERAELARCREWKAEEFAAGFGWIDGPAEYGGRGLTRAHRQAYERVKARFATPSEKLVGISLGMIAPTLLSHGTEAVKQRYLEALWRAEIVGCQLFSEPGAGSDLAGVSTKATLAGAGAWRISGQKVWTSGAHLCSIGEVLCRDADATEARGHVGLSAFVVDMHAPGVTVRPIRQMTGGASFNEVFFDDVLVDESHLLGEPGGGWKVAVATLMNERSSIGGGGAASKGGVGFARVLELARSLGVTDDPLMRQELVLLQTGLQLARWTARRMATTAPSAVRDVSGPLGKMALVRNQRRIADIAASALGPMIAADTGEPGRYAWAQYVLGVPGSRIAGGTDEILRNIVAERGLGLPKGS